MHLPSDQAVQVTLLPAPPPGLHHNQPASSSTSSSAASSTATGYKNPWPSFRSPALKDLWDALTKGAVLKSPPGVGEEEVWDRNGRLVKVREPVWRSWFAGKDKGKGKDKERGKVCWLGHAGVFLQVPGPRRRRSSSDPSVPETLVPADNGESQRKGTGTAGRTGTRVNDNEEEEEQEMVGILFDPIFSQRCSPSQHIGPSRYLPAACPVASLPPIHIVCISHDHYDHLDYTTIMDLYGMNPGIHFFVPLGLKQWFLACHIPESQVSEMDWHQRAHVLVFPHLSASSSSSRHKKNSRHRRREDQRREGSGGRMRKGTDRGWYRAGDEPYRDFSSEEEDIEGVEAGAGGGYPPRPPRASRTGVNDRPLRARKNNQRLMRIMPGAFGGAAAASDGDDDRSAQSEDLESGGGGGGSGSSASSDLESDVDSVSATSASASDSEGGRGSRLSVAGGGEEEGMNLPLLKNTVPPPRSRPLRPKATTGMDGTALRLQRRKPVRIEIVCTPAQHRSGRGLCDQMKSLWASWVLRVIPDDEAGEGEDEEVARGADVDRGIDQDVREKKGFNVFFGGDTGYRYAGALEGEREMFICPAFQEIAHRYGPMDLCLLPISTGSSLSFLRNLFGFSLHHYSLTSAQHSNAWDAIQIAKLMQAKRTIAIHHSTFSPEDEARGCVYEFVNTAKEEGVPQNWEEDGCFIVADIGEVLEIP